MEFTEAISSGFRNYVNFSSRSRRSEYWYWALFVTLVAVVAAIVDAATTGYLLGALFSLATILPDFAVAVRRLHDIDRSGWWLLLALVPIIGWIVLFIWSVTEGTRGENRLGATPL